MASSHIFKLMTNTQRERIKQFQIRYERQKIEIYVQFHHSYQYPFFTIVYEQEGSDTVISKKHTKKEITVEDSDISEVFCDDLKSIIVNQKRSFDCVIIEQFDLESDQDKGYIIQYLDPIANRIYECFQNGKNGKLATRSLYITPSNMEQLTTILTCVHLEELAEVYVGLMISDESMSIMEIVELKEFKKSKELVLKIGIDEFNSLNYEVAKKAAIGNKSLGCLTIMFKTCDEKSFTKFSNVRITMIGDKEFSAIILKTHAEFYYEGSMSRWEKAFENHRRKKQDRYYSYYKELSGPLGEMDKNCLNVLGNTLVMRKVLNDLSCLEIQGLRRMSPVIRDAIAIIKPDPKIDEFSFFLGGFGTIFIEIGIGEDDAKRIVYQDLDYDCWGRQRILTWDIQKKFLEDFTRHFEHQNESTLKTLSFGTRHVTHWMVREHTSMFLDKLEKVLKSWRQLLRVENFIMHLSCQDDLMKILPYLDPETLKTIEVKVFYGIRKEVELQLDKIGELEQWKQAEMIKFYWVTIPTDFQFITHFAKAEIRVALLTDQDLYYLKEELQKSSNLIEIRIKFDSTTVDESSYALLGIPNTPPNDPMADVRKTWYYRHMDSDHVLLVLFYTEKKIVTFSRKFFPIRRLNDMDD